MTTEIEQAPTEYPVLSIDGWNSPDGWNWNAWYRVTPACPAAVIDSPRKLLRWFRAAGLLSAKSAGRCALDDDGYNVVVIDRKTREPLFAVEYGSAY